MIVIVIVIIKLSIMGVRTMKVLRTMSMMVFSKLSICMILTAVVSMTMMT